MSQQSRRHDPYPWTWEIPVGIALVILLVLGVHLGRATANVLSVAGWRFPPLVDLFSSLPAVLRGDAGAGLTGFSGQSPSRTTLWVCVVATELMLLAALVVLLKAVLGRWGPSRMRGMASSGAAERLLGGTRLRRVRAVVRPDVYGKRRHPA
jgi:hypothetical protein